jgi:hypothetical protein
MADDTFRPERRRPTRELIDDQQGVEDPWAETHSPREHTPPNIPVAHDDLPPPAMPTPQNEGGLEIKGNIPPQFAAMLRGQAPDGNVQTRQAHRQTRPEFASNQGKVNNEQLENIFRRLTNKTHHYEPVVLPSKGKFYDGTDGPVDGVVYLRPMTGEEEQILATPGTSSGARRST